MARVSGTTCSAAAHSHSTSDPRQRSTRSGFSSTCGLGQRFVTRCFHAALLSFCFLHLSPVISHLPLSSATLPLGHSDLHDNVLWESNFISGARSKNQQSNQPPFSRQVQLINFVICYCVIPKLTNSPTHTHVNGRATGGCECTSFLPRPHPHMMVGSRRVSAVQLLLDQLQRLFCLKRSSILDMCSTTVLRPPKSFILSSQVLPPCCMG